MAVEPVRVPVTRAKNALQRLLHGLPMVSVVRALQALDCCALRNRYQKSTVLSLDVLTSLREVVLLPCRRRAGVAVVVENDDRGLLGIGTMNITVRAYVIRAGTAVPP